jgi:hypothetical protein
MFSIPIQYGAAIVLLGLMAAFLQWGSPLHRPLLETMFHTHSSQECQMGLFGPFSFDELMKCATQLVAFIPRWVYDRIVSIHIENKTKRKMDFKDFLRLIPVRYQKNLHMINLNDFMWVETRTLQSDILRVFDAVLLTGLFQYSLMLSVVLLFLYSVRNGRKLALKLLACGANKKQRLQLLQDLKVERVKLTKKFVGILFIPLVVTLTYRVVAGTRILTFSGASNEAVLASADSYGFMAAVIITICLIISEINGLEDFRFITLSAPIVICMVIIFVLQSPALLRDHNTIPAHVKTKTCNKAFEGCKSVWTFHNLAIFVDQLSDNLDSILRGELQTCKSIPEMVRTQSEFSPSTCNSFRFSIEEILFENKVILREEWTLFSPVVLLGVVAQSCALPLLVCAWIFFVLYVLVSVFYSVELQD